jgi:hypothetical protein
MRILRLLWNLEGVGVNGKCYFALYCTQSSRKCYMPMCEFVMTKDKEKGGVLCTIMTEGQGGTKICQRRERRGVHRA